MHVTLLGGFSPEEVITVIDCIYIAVPLQVDELAMGDTSVCVPEGIRVNFKAIGWEETEGRGKEATVRCPRR